MMDRVNVPYYAFTQHADSRLALIPRSWRPGKGDRGRKRNGCSTEPRRYIHNRGLRRIDNTPASFNSCYASSTPDEDTSARTASFVSRILFDLFPIVHERQNLIRRQCAPPSTAVKIHGRGSTLLNSAHKTRRERLISTSALSLPRKRGLVHKNSNISERAGPRDEIGVRARGGIQNP